MASRKRAQEVKKHGYLIGSEGAPQPIRATVTDQDRQLCGSLVRWTLGYINHIYEIGGHSGQPMPKRPTESVSWYIHIGEGADFTTPLWVSTLQRYVKYPSFSSFETDKLEYRRQLLLGVDVSFTAESHPEGASRSTIESVKLEIDADGAIVGGRYYWIADEHQERPVSDANFTSLDEAHSSTVTSRLADLLGQFRELTLRDPEVLNVHGLYNHAISLIPPEALIPIPDFRANILQ